MTVAFEHREQLTRLADAIRLRSHMCATGHAFVVAAVVTTSSMKRTQRIPRI